MQEGRYSMGYGYFVSASYSTSLRYLVPWQPCWTFRSYLWAAEHYFRFNLWCITAVCRPRPVLLGEQWRISSQYCCSSRKVFPYDWVRLSTDCIYSCWLGVRMEQLQAKVATVNVIAYSGMAPSSLEYSRWGFAGIARSPQQKMNGCFGMKKVARATYNGSRARKYYRFYLLMECTYIRRTVTCTLLPKYFHSHWNDHLQVYWRAGHDYWKIIRRMSIKKGRSFGNRLVNDPVPTNCA